MSPKFFQHDIEFKPKSYLELFNATLDCGSTEAADGRTDGGGGQGLRHGFTFLVLCA